MALAAMGARAAARSGAVKGLASAIAKTEAVRIGVGEAQRMVMSFVLSNLVNYAKLRAPFTDRTGNLRASISWKILERGVLSGTGTPGSGIVGIFYAGMHYAVHVEVKDGYWVLSGAMKDLEPLIGEMLGKNLRTKKILQRSRFSTTRLAG